MLRSFRCRLGRGASQTSLFSLCCGDMVEIISLLGSVFMKFSMSKMLLSLSWVTMTTKSCSFTSKWAWHWEPYASSPAAKWVFPALGLWAAVMVTLVILGRKPQFMLDTIIQVQQHPCAWDISRSFGGYTVG